MSGPINLTEVDFEQIKNNLIDYLKSTEQFTDYDFDGSNLQVILNLIAYQAQLNAYSTNMIANESFLASATLRDNVVANARLTGYIPVSARSASTRIEASWQLSAENYPSGFPQYLQIQPGPAFNSGTNNENYVFNLVDTQTAAVTSSGYAVFTNLPVSEGAYLTADFTVDKSDYNQRFLLDNANIDTVTIRVEVQEDPNQEVLHSYVQAQNLVELTSESRVFWLEEVEGATYELTFGDGLFGKALVDGAKVYIHYIVSSGAVANGIQGVSNFDFVGRVYDTTGTRITIEPTIASASKTDGGSDIESVSSIKFRAPRDYSAQSRCVIAEDYAAKVRSIYPAIDDIYVFGGEELDIPQYGRVYIVIKPSSGNTLSAITKNYIKKSLDNYRIASVDLVLVDADILNIEVVTTVYYDDTKTLKDNAAIAASARLALGKYAESRSVKKFGGAVRYSRVLGVIDDSDTSITRNNTVLRMRRDVGVVVNTKASYEICFENAVSPTTVYSTGFKMLVNGINDQRTYFFEDDGKGNLYSFYFSDSNDKVITNTTFGTVEYDKGECKIGYNTDLTVLNTSVDGGIVEIRATPVAQDVLAKKTVAINFDISKSDILSVVDTEIAGS